MHPAWHTVSFPGGWRQVQVSDQSKKVPQAKRAIIILSGVD